MTGSHRHQRPKAAGEFARIELDPGAGANVRVAWLLVPDLPEYRTGLILVGLARCIAMVITGTTSRVVIGKLPQSRLRSTRCSRSCCSPSSAGSTDGNRHNRRLAVADRAIGFYLFGIPLAAGYLSRRLGEKAKGRPWYESQVLPEIGPWALYGLLFTIVVLFGSMENRSPVALSMFSASRYRYWSTSR